MNPLSALTPVGTMFLLIVGLRKLEEDSQKAKPIRTHGPVGNG